jgi:hypothetical protein
MAPIKKFFSVLYYDLIYKTRNETALFIKRYFNCTHVVIVALPITYRLVNLVPVNLRTRFKENSARTLLGLRR